MEVLSVTDEVVSVSVIGRIEPWRSGRTRNYTLRDSSSITSDELYQQRLDDFLSSIFHVLFP